MLSIYEIIGMAYCILCTALVTVCIAYFGWQGVKQSARLIDLGQEKQKESELKATGL